MLQVLSITRLDGGDAYNIIPSTAEFGGTLRAFSPGVAAMAQRRIREIVEGVAAAHGCSAHVSWREEVRVTTPATWNHPRLAKMVADAVNECAACPLWRGLA